MKSFECSICSTQFKDPVECLKCSNNFCKVHISNFNNRCPLCHNTPFIYRENVWLKRTLLNLNDFYKCSICQFEGDYDSFWSHLIESHKNEIINQFKCKKNNCEAKSINFQPPKNISIQKSIGTNVNDKYTNNFESQIDNKGSVLSEDAELKIVNINN